MKSSVSYILITAFTFALHITTGFAQDFVVTSAGDTIRGEIKALSYGTDKKVQVTQQGKKKTLYPIYQIKSFSNKGELFQTVKGPSGYTFMKVIKSGYLSLLSFQLENQVQYDGSYLLKKDGTGMELPNISFKKAMKKFLDDCPSVVDKIEIDELNKKDLNKIIDAYNDCIRSKSMDQAEAIAVRTTQTKKISAWDILEEKVKAQPDFKEKANALEMINEIKTKIASSQKIPNFLLEGLKSSLNQDIFKTELANALQEAN